MLSKRRKKLVAVVVTFSLVAAALSGLAKMPRGEARAAVDYGINNPMTDSNGVTTWDKVRFGSYYQTAEFEPEPIKWRVLSVDGDDALLLADQCLDAKPYNTEDEDVTWETCSLRKWLNEDFYNEAFSDSEKAAIKETTVVNEDNNQGKGGNDTDDHVYLLSIEEMNNAEYGFMSDETRKSEVTDYARFNNESSKVWWWLRSPGTGTDYGWAASNVGDTGGINWSGDHYWYLGGTVRPTLHLNLSYTSYQDAGEVDSKGKVNANNDGIGNPKTDSDGVTTWDCVYFGTYKQTVTFIKEPVEWRVLSVDGDDAFLLADQCLDCQSYNTEWESVTWETCSLRKWLNDDFYNEAFSSSEKAAIKETKVINGDNLKYGIEGGDNTDDHVFLLSFDEVGNTKYGFTKYYEEEGIRWGITRGSKITDYARFNGASRKIQGYDIVGLWWLRSPGYSSFYASGVSTSGYVYEYGAYVDYEFGAVRPVLHLNLSSDSWSRAGQIRSDGAEGSPPLASKNPNPSVKPEETAPTEATNQPQVTDSQQTPTTPSANIVPNPTSYSGKAFKLGAVAIKSAKNSKKGIATLTWKKAGGVAGYQIQYALNQKFTKGKKTKTTAKTSYSIKNLKKKKTYFIRIRAYQQAGSEKVYGAWSKVKKVKIKK